MMDQQQQQQPSLISESTEAKLDPEVGLSMSKEPLWLLNSLSTAKTECDYFLRLWNSEVGDSFRKANDYGVACQSPPVSSQVSSSAREDSSSGVTRTQKHAESIISTKRDSAAELMLGSSESSRSYDESSDITMKLLLDLPEDDEMAYLQEPIEDVSIYLQDSII